MTLVKEFITSAKDLKMTDIVVRDDLDGTGRKASFPNIEIQPNSSIQESFELAGFGVDDVSAIEDLSEKLHTALERGQLVKVAPDIKLQHLH